MTTLEYKVVPAPIQGKKSKDAKTTEARFAHALSDILNDMAVHGWHYVRAETLPCEERKGLTGKTMTFQNVLIFSRMSATLPDAFDNAEDEEARDMSHEEVEEDTSPVLLTQRAEEEYATPPLGGARRSD